MNQLETLYPILIISATQRAGTCIWLSHDEKRVCETCDMLSQITRTIESVTRECIPKVIVINMHTDSYTGLRTAWCAARSLCIVWKCELYTGEYLNNTLKIIDRNPRSLVYRDH